MSDTKHEWIVGLSNRNDLDQFYSDMASTSGNSFIPSRTVECLSARPISRNTHYSMTLSEAISLSGDSRVFCVERLPEDLGFSVEVDVGEIRYPTPSTLSGYQPVHNAGESEGQFGYVKSFLGASEDGSGNISGENNTATAINNINKFGLAISSLAGAGLPLGSHANIGYSLYDMTTYPNRTTLFGAISFRYDGNFGGFESNIIGGGHSAKTSVYGYQGIEFKDENPLRFYSLGKNVDLIIADSPMTTDVQDWQDFETGVSRFVQYQWFDNLSVYVGDGRSGTITYRTQATIAAGNTHGINCASCAAGAYYGFAKKANLYSMNVISPAETGYISPILAFDYARAFHKYKGINPETGLRNPTIMTNSWSYNSRSQIASILGKNYSSDSVVLSDIQSYVSYEAGHQAGVEYSATNPPSGGWNEDNLTSKFGIAFGNQGFKYHGGTLLTNMLDVIDACEEGVVMTTSAGNFNKEHVKMDDPRFNDFLKFQNSGGDFVGGIYPKRGGFPNGPSIINVGALDTMSSNHIRPTTFSDHGSEVDCWAPGKNIHVAAAPGGSAYPDLKYGGTNNNQWWNLVDGTSFSCPIVAGVLACAAGASNTGRFTMSDAYHYLETTGLSGAIHFNQNWSQTGNSAPGSSFSYGNTNYFNKYPTNDLASGWNGYSGENLGHINASFPDPGIQVDQYSLSFQGFGASLYPRLMNLRSIQSRSYSLQGSPGYANSLVAITNRNDNGFSDGSFSSLTLPRGGTYSKFDFNHDPDRHIGGSGMEVGSDHSSGLSRTSLGSTADSLNQELDSDYESVASGFIKTQKGSRTIQKAEKYDLALYGRHLAWKTLSAAEGPAQVYPRPNIFMDMPTVQLSALDADHEDYATEVANGTGIVTVLNQPEVT